MILYRWRGMCSNFGDELNTLLWPALLPGGFFDDDPAVRFLGIGSVLDQRHPAEPTKLVAGSGYGGYEAKPRIGKDFVIHWVRGPRTAAALGLSPALGLGDPATLLPTALRLPATTGEDIGFMPHFESAARGAWQQAAASAGIRLIDPRDPPSSVLHAIANCRVLLSEALHGAIVADALRVPWVAIRPRATVHRAKWHDWADTVGLTIHFRGLPASTHAEWASATCLTHFHTTRRLLSRHEPSLKRLAAEPLIARAGTALRATAGMTPQLSSDSALNRCRSRMLEAVHALRADPLKRPTTPAVRSHLQRGAESAYELQPITDRFGAGAISEHQIAAI